MRILALGLAAGLAALAAPADAAQSQPITTCEPKGPARPVCSFTNPEDLVALPGGEAILVSEYGGMEGHIPGALALLVLDTDERRDLFRGGSGGAATPGWGDPACPGPLSAAFSPHGIHLSTRDGGELQLLVVQHGGRESIEYFEVSGSGRDWSVEWRGCVVAPDDAWLNSGGGAARRRLRHHPHDRAALPTAPTSPRPLPGAGMATSWSGCPIEGTRFSAGARARCPTASRPRPTGAWYS